MMILRIHLILFKYLSAEFSPFIEIKNFHSSVIQSTLITKTGVVPSPASRNLCIEQF